MIRWSCFSSRNSFSSTCCRNRSDTSQCRLLTTTSTTCLLMFDNRSFGRNDVRYLDLRSVPSTSADVSGSGVFRHDVVGLAGALRQNPGPGCTP